MCRDYQCAWSQHLFDNDMRPDQIGLMVSVENGLDNEQFLKVIEVWEHVPAESYVRLKEYVDKLGTDVVYVKYQKEINE